MPRYKEDLPVVRVYTVCDESRYLIVRNVPALGCGDDLLKLFATYGDVEECKPMDAEDCEQFTDVYWIKFQLISNARFAKRKLDEFVFLGNRLQVSYAPQFESLDDTKDKLEGRRKEVLARLNPQRSKGHPVHHLFTSSETPSLAASSQHLPKQTNSRLKDVGDSDYMSHINNAPITRVSSDKDYFPSQSMNQTVKTVRDKLNKYALRLLYVAIGVGLSAFVEGICWTRTAERQTSRIRTEYLKSVLRQEVGSSTHRKLARPRPSKLCQPYQLMPMQFKLQYVKRYRTALHLFQLSSSASLFPSHCHGNLP